MTVMPTNQLLLGAHLSIAGGVVNALEAARRHAFNVLAMFVRSHRQWRSPELPVSMAREFRRTRSRLGIRAIVAHGSYLVNLAAAGPLRRRSVEAMLDEMDRCRRLGIEFLNIHPGCCQAQRQGIKRVAIALAEIVDRHGRGGPRVLLELTAGQGGSLGSSFEQMAELLSTLSPVRFGVCIDTCHVFAAGYDIRTPETYSRTMDEFDRVIGLGRLSAVHLNDSKRELGSRVDRHEHIGKGLIGAGGIANFVRDPRLADVPKLLETPKGLDPQGRDYDDLNAETVRQLWR